jgi:pyruvate/2-oxoglutarate dehydrogenase complex dihydrolipoamide acyltransferase (E2) component
VTRLQGSGRHGRVTKRDVLDAVAQGTGAATPPPAPGAPGGAGDDAPMHIESPYRPDPTLLVAGAQAVPAGGAADVVPPTTPATPAVPPAPGSAVRSSSAASAPSTSPAVSAPPAVPDDLGGVVTPMSRMRSSIGTAMRRALDTAAHCTTVVECDMSRIERRRRELGVTALPLLARHAIDALREFPALNATFDGETLRRYERVHLGIAVSLGEDGLIVPVLHDAQDLSAEGIARRIKDVAVRARERRLAPDEVRGGTFTITNPGASGALIATPVINVPQVAILDLEAIVRRPVVVTDPDGQESIAIRPMVNLCMSWDHRVLDGVYAARFLTALRGRIEGGTAD